MFFVKKKLCSLKKDICHYSFVLILIILFISINCCAKAEKSRYVYIVGGAYKGERIIDFKRTDIYSSHRWEIFAIEANPYIIDKIPKAKDTVILNKAIWIKNDKIKFFFSPQEDNYGSVYEKNYGEKAALPIFIESIDFGKWLQKNFTIHDHIMVSLDIEGAEYEVLNKMIMDQTIKYIDGLFVEFHPDIDGKSEDDIERLVQKIKKFDIMIERVNM
jgi:FkbM family methyltransferase